MIYNLTDNSIGLVRLISKKLKVDDIFSLGLINVEVVSTLQSCDSRHAPFGVYREGCTDYWNSKNNSPSRWYQVEFKHFKVFIKGYYFAHNPIHYMRNWKILGSDNGVDWDILDERILENKPDKTKNVYECQNPLSRRYIRYQSDSTNFDDNSYITLGSFDLLGSVLWCFNSNKICHKYHHYLSFMCLILL